MAVVAVSCCSRSYDAASSMAGASCSGLSYLDTSIIWRPRNESDLRSRALTAGKAVLKVVNGVSWALGQSTRLGLGLGVDKLLTESIPVGLLGGVLDDDGLVVVGERVDDVFDRLAKLELVELGDALWCDLDSIVVG